MFPYRKLRSILLVTLCAGAPILAAVKTETLEYKQDTASLEGMLVYETGKGKKPGILLVPDWMGVSDVARQYAEKVAKLGYVVLVADIFGKGVRPKDAKEAAAQAGIYRGDRALLQARAQAGLAQLLKSARVDTSRIAAMGYCFGGGAALELARSGANLDGIVSFHGNLDTPHPEQARNIKGPVLILHGAEDPFVPEEQVEAFEAEMRKANVDWTLTMYSGAVHSFTNPTAGSDPSKGAAYHPKADSRSWSTMRDFYAEIFTARTSR